MEQSAFTPPPASGDQQDASAVQEAASRVAGQAQEKAQQASAQARDRVREQVGERSNQAGEQLTGTASDMRAVAEELSKQGKDQPAKLATQAAERAERVGSYLKDSDADRLLHDLEEFGRGKPWAVVLGGVVAGLAASRFLKASSGERYRAGESYGNGGQGRARGVQTVSQLPDLAPSPTLGSGR